MKRKNLRFESGFRVVLGNRGSQAAEMVLPPGAPRKAAAKIATAALISGCTYCQEPVSPQ